MHRLTIFAVLAAASLAWVLAQQRELSAWQTEAEPAQAVESSDEAGPSEQPAEPSEDSQTPPEGEPDPEVAAAAVKLLRDARDRLYYDYKSVRATFVERANIGNRQFTGEGEYLAGPFPQLRLEYRVRVGGSEGHLVEVCDGKILRTSKEIRPIDGASREPTLSQWTRKDISQIGEAVDQNGTPEAAVLQAELSLGGLPTLLASLERTMEFDTLREQTHHGQTFIVIQGRWRPEYIQKFSEQMGSAASSLGRFLPSRVRVYFDKESLFPTRILYLQQVSDQPVRYRAMLTLEFQDIRLNEEIDPQAFRHLPPKGVDEIDETAAYLRLIQSLRAAGAPPEPGQNPQAQEPQSQTPADSPAQPAAPVEQAP